MGRRQAFIDAMMGYVNDDSHGYDQSDRWGPDYDCSSLVYQCAYDAGYDVPTDDPRYTGAMVEDFTHAGFTRLDPGVTLVPGDICLNRTHHVMMYVKDSPDLLAGARINEHGHACGGTQGDQTGREICTQAYYDYPWTDILRPPEDDGSDHAPTPAPSGRRQVAVDGNVGPDSTSAWQQVMGTEQDGVISGQDAACDRLFPNLSTREHGSGGSDLVRAIQSMEGISQDGNFGPDTIRHWQGEVGTDQDGSFGPATATATQQWVNGRL